MKEVERLEKNREERRARQAEIKEEKKALMNMDPGNVIQKYIIDVTIYFSCIFGNGFILKIFR